MINLQERKAFFIIDGQLVLCSLIDEFLQSDALNSCAYGVIQFSILNTGRLKVPVRCSRSNEIVGFISCKVNSTIIYFDKQLIYFTRWSCQN